MSIEKISRAKGALTTMRKHLAFEAPITAPAVAAMPEIVGTTFWSFHPSTFEVDRVTVVRAKTMPDGRFTLAVQGKGKDRADHKAYTRQYFYDKADAVMASIVARLDGVEEILDGAKVALGTPDDAPAIDADPDKSDAADSEIVENSEDSPEV